MSNVQPHHESKARILDAALRVIRTKGYSATTIDDVCATAGLTKGSFFHHFKSKDELALAATAHFAAMADGLFAAAPYRTLPDPRERVIGYVKFRKSILTGDLPEFTCFAGNIIQEAYATHPEIAAACEKNVSGHAQTLERDIGEAMQKYGVRADWTAESLALHTQAVLQGAFILAKAKGGADVAVQSLDHLRRYLELLFVAGKSRAPRKGRGRAARG